MRPWYTLDVGPFGSQTRSGRYKEEKHLSPCWEPEFVSPVLSNRNTAVIATEQSHIQLFVPLDGTLGAI